MKTRFVAPVVVVSLLAIFTDQLSTCLAQGTAFTFQGRLTDGGNPANGLYDFRSGPVATNSGGALIAGPVTNKAVMVSNGLFMLTLDYGATFDCTPYWLQMGVRTNGGGTFIGLSPRPEVTPTPYAIFAITASNLSGTLPAAQLSGIIPSSALSGTYGNVLNLNNAANTFTGNFTGNGASVTSLNANNLASGEVPDARLSVNVALRAGGNALTGNQTITSGDVGIGTTSPKTALQVNGPNGTAIRVVGPAGGGSTVAYDLSTYDPGTNPPAAQILATDNGNYGNDLDFMARIPGSATNALVSRLHIDSTTGIISGNGSGLTNLNANTFNGLAALWQTGGNNVSAGQFLGSTNIAPVELWVGAQRALRLEPDTTGNGSPNVIGGSPANAAVGSPALHGVTIAGGGSTNLSGYFANSASANYTTISGGLRNEGNGIGATVGGGEYNFANGQFATVPGGNVNTASGDFSFAAGNRAQALYQGDFVWADSQASDFISTANDQFLIRAGGGVGINTASPDAALTVNGAADKPGGGSWNTFSDGRLKDVGGSFTTGLDALVKLQPVRYHYKADNPLQLPSQPEYVGVVAQQVQVAVPEAVQQNKGDDLIVNNDPIIWTMVNAIKELKQKVEVRNQQLEAENAELKTRLERLEKLLAERN